MTQYRTFEAWKAIDRVVIRGQKAAGRTTFGTSLFTFEQTTPLPTFADMNQEHREGDDEFSEEPE